MNRLILSTIAFLASFFCLQAKADVKVELRTDFEDHQFNDAYQTANYSTFRINRARLKIDNSVDDFLSYTVRLNLNSGYTVDPTGTSPVSNRSIADNTTGLLEWAYISYRFTPELTLTMGKMGTLTGGMEGQYSGGDVYVYSQTSPLWSTYSGVGLNYVFNEHTFSFNLANQDSPYKDPSKSDSYAQKNLAAAFQYYGFYLDKKFQVIASYLYSKPQSSTLSERQDSFAALGFRYEFGSAYVELDQLINTFKNKTTMDTTDSQTGLVANTAIIFDRLKYSLKYAAESAKISDQKSADYTTIGASAEYTPSIERNMNFHIAYNSITTKPTSGADSKIEQQVILGLKFYFSALKQP